MPIFDWVCDKCDAKVERISKKEDKLRCPRCGKEMHTIPTQANFMLKGHCWACDGYSGRRGDE